MGNRLIKGIVAAAPKRVTLAMHLTPVTLKLLIYETGGKSPASWYCYEEEMRLGR